ncbi:MAG: lysozyme inhibitor LprI family protein [Gammaproteobacteria bacterium]|nr:lysozyme inhibitor LprI family protein [Gammaproteobacteria bacterium]
MVAKMITQTNIGLKGLVLLSMMMLVNTANAIDNPDTPNYIEEFQARELQHLEKIDNPHSTTPGLSETYAAYQFFLDQELNIAYKLIRSKLSAERQAELKQSQRKWIKFRDAEFEFINHNWIRKNFGSSSGLSRGHYRTTIIKNRILQLLFYAINY